MVAFVHYNDFAEQILKAVHDLDGTHTLKVALSNTIPAATDTDLASAAEIAAGAGYTAGGTATTPSVSESPAGTGKLVCTDVVFTSTGAFAQFQYAILYNETSDLLLASWDYGSAVDLADTETFTVDFDATNGVLTATGA